MKEWARLEADGPPIETLLMDYCAAFGLDPETVRPKAATVYQWGLYQSARNSREVWLQSRHVENWAEKMTPEQKRLMVWAVDTGDG